MTDPIASAALKRHTATQLITNAGHLFNVPSVADTVSIRVTGDAFDRHTFGIISGQPSIGLGDGTAVADFLITRNGVASVNVTGVINMTSPVLTTGVSGTAVDTDSTMAANSDTKLASQKAIKTALALKSPLASPTFTGHPTVEGVTSTGATGTGKFVFDTAPSFTTSVTSPNFFQIDGTATDGQIKTQALAAGTQAIGGYDNTADTLPNWVVGRIAGLYTNVGLFLGPANGASDVSLFRNGVGTGQLAGQITVSAGLTMAAGVNIATNTTTGTIFGVTSSQKIAVWGATPIVRGTAFTQTYSTASHTQSALTATNPPAGGTGATAGAYDSAVHRDAMITSLTNLIADHTNTKNVLNGLIDDLQAIGWVP